jgi:hypothetical protein
LLYNEAKGAKASTMAAAPLEDKIYLDSQDILRVEQRGVTDKPKATHMLNRMRQLSAKLLGQQKNVLVMADIRELKGFAPGTERVGLEIRETIPFSRMAIVIDDGETKIVRKSETITAQSSRKKEIGYFNSEATAIKWLLE